MPHLPTHLPAGLLTTKHLKIVKDVADAQRWIGAHPGLKARGQLAAWAGRAAGGPAAPLQHAVHRCYSSVSTLSLHLHSHALRRRCCW